MSKLLESSFLTVNLQALVSKQSSEKVTNDARLTKADSSEETSSISNESKNLDWGQELKRRLADNKSLSTEARIPEHEIENKLFLEYFKSGWGEEQAKLLMAIGPNLRKAIKVLGFKKQTNPIVAFLSLNYVKNSLIQTKLLNANTFKAIYNAVANKWVVDSEFYKANNYNILYCKDLYKKSLAEMIEYIKLQKNVLDTSAEVYTAADQEKNKRVFLVLTRNTEKDINVKAKKQLELAYGRLPSMLEDKALLNSLALVRAILGVNTKNSEKETSSNKLTGSNAIKAIAEKNLTTEQTAAILQYLGASTGSTAALKALSHKNFKSLSIDKLIRATSQIASLISKVDFSNDEADELAKVLIRKIT